MNGSAGASCGTDLPALGATLAGLHGGGEHARAGLSMSNVEKSEVARSRRRNMRPPEQHACPRASQIRRDLRAACCAGPCRRSLHDVAASRLERLGDVRASVIAAGSTPAPRPSLARGPPRSPRPGRCHAMTMSFAALALLRYEVAYNAPPGAPGTMAYLIVPGTMALRERRTARQRRRCAPSECRSCRSSARRTRGRGNPSARANSRPELTRRCW